jgi:uncharacterized protein (TIGR00255 family)
MLRSMTGYGSASGMVDGVEYVVECRSVNNRYFKAAIKLPENLGQLETEFENILRSKVTRGTVTMNVRMRIPDDQAAYHVNTVALRQYIDQLRELEVEANPTLRIELSSLLLLPGVCQPPALEDLVDRSREALLSVVARAVDDLLRMRQHEGQTVRADLLGNCKLIEDNLERIRSLAPRVVQDYHARLSQRVAELLDSGKFKLDEATLAREVAVFAERCDIAEEIARLTAHLGQFRSALDEREPAGRKLDFIAQEMLREANTIASKGNDAEIARAVVEIKTAVDRIKEQAANVE